MEKGHNEEHSSGENLERQEIDDGKNILLLMQNIASYIWVSNHYYSYKDLDPEVRKRQLADLFSQAGLKPPDPSLSREEFEQFIINTVTYQIQYAATPRPLCDPGEGIPFEFTEGEIIYENKDVKLQLSDANGEMVKDSRLSDLVDVIKQEVQNFRTFRDSMFKAEIVVNAGMIGIRTDLGSHKEYLGVVLAQPGRSGHALWYRHSPSQYELENSKNRARFDYVKNVAVYSHLNSGVNNNPKVDSSKKSVENFVVIDSRAKLQEELGYYLRLAHSVKNLDMALTDDNVVFAKKMFDSGVNNMQIFLSFINSESYEAVAPRLSTRLLTENELALIKEYYEYKTKLDEIKGGIRNSLEFFKEAKDLNFKLLEQLRNFEYAGRQVLASSSESAKSADSILRQLRDIGEGLKKMKQLVA